MQPQIRRRFTTAFPADKLGPGSAARCPGPTGGLGVGALLAAAAEADPDEVVVGDGGRAGRRGEARQPGLGRSGGLRRQVVVWPHGRAAADCLQLWQRALLRQRLRQGDALRMQY